MKGGGKGQWKGVGGAQGQDAMGMAGMQAMQGMMQAMQGMMQMFMAAKGAMVGGMGGGGCCGKGHTNAGKGAGYGAAKGGCYQGAQAAPYQSNQPMRTPAIASRPATQDDMAQVEKFLATCQVEEKAAHSLRELPPDIQQMVINKGSLEDSRDQTAVLISRIKLARDVASGNTANPVIAALRPGDWICPGCLDHQFARNAECRKCGAANPAGPAPDAEIEVFLGAQELEQHAVDQFLTLGTDLQKLVMSRGSLAGARDCTAVLCKRMAQARRGELMPGSGGNQDVQDGDWYCPACNDLQFRRNQVCRKCGTPNPGSQAADPTPGQSGFGMTGMQKGMGKGMGSIGGYTMSGDVEAFLHSVHVDDHAKEQFLTLGASLQQLVMSRGSLDAARDPTAVLVTRMRQARSGELQPGTGGGNMSPQDGDWYCPGCNDLQFKRNTVCRKCGTPNPAPASGAAQGLFQPVPRFGQFHAY